MKRLSLIVLCVTVGFVLCFYMLHGVDKAHAEYSKWKPPTSGFTPPTASPDGQETYFMNYVGAVPTRKRRVFPDGTVENTIYTTSGGLITQASVSWTEP